MQNKNLLKHSLAAEAAMRGIYRHVTPKDKQSDADEEIWGISGLLHDIDYEIAQNENKLDRHGILLFETGQVKLPEAIEHAIKAHNYTATKVDPESQMDWSITACDQLTGLITACALVRPEKQLASVTTESVMKKFGQKAFAAGADRNAILFCESKLDIPLQEFIEITLKAMQGISKDLGL
jgi:predicted hydrolase (HD superfamily)